MHCCCSRLQPEASKQIPNRSRPSRNKTKKVIGGATDEEIAEHAARPRPPRPAMARQLQRNRPKAKNGKMRAGKNINDAAEALLGMGSGFVDDELMVCSAVLLGSLAFSHQLWSDAIINCQSHWGFQVHVDAVCCQFFQAAQQQHEAVRRFQPVSVEFHNVKRQDSCANA